MIADLKNFKNMNDFIEYYSNVWLQQAIKDNNCSTERELYNKTLIDNEKINI